MNSRLARLHPYPFARLAELLEGVDGNSDLAPISLAVGEPKHRPPPLVAAALTAQLDQLNRYPPTAGIQELRGAIANWLEGRFALGTNTIDPSTMVLPAVGTREALFALAQAIVSVDDGSEASKPLVVMPSPFYQIYEGAAIMAGAEPYYLPCERACGGMPDYDAVAPDVWRRCQLLYLCSPGNPTGAVHKLADLQKLIALADQYDFVIASDECYSEIYIDESAPPPSLLSACRGLGRDRFERCIVFNSLSKRSSVPGLRSGLVAGDPDIIAAFLLYRTYHGSAMPLHHQWASVAAWADEDHVVANRATYRKKLTAVHAILSTVMDVELPAGGFCLWPIVGGDDTRFVRDLFEQQHVTALPGSYLGRDLPRDTGGCSGAEQLVAGSLDNAGSGHLRLALVFPLDVCIEAAERIVTFVAQRR